MKMPDNEDLVRRGQIIAALRDSYCKDCDGCGSAIAAAECAHAVDVTDALDSVEKLISTMRNNKKAVLWIRRYGKEARKITPQ